MLDLKLIPGDATDRSRWKQQPQNDEIVKPTENCSFTKYANRNPNRNADTNLFHQFSKFPAFV